MGAEPAMPRPHDGRSARRERGRAAVLDAVFTLAREGSIPPPVEQVAERAGVSVSSVFRYFDSLEDLQLRTIERFRAQFAPRFASVAPIDGSLTTRVDSFVTGRLGIYRDAGRLMVLARLRAFENPRLAEPLVEVRTALTAQVTTWFAPELAPLTGAARGDLVAVLDTLTGPEAWDAATRLHHRTERQLRRAWSAAVASLLPAVGGEAGHRQPRPSHDQEVDR